MPETTTTPALQETATKLKAFLDGLSPAEQDCFGQIVMPSIHRCFGPPGHPPADLPHPPGMLFAEVWASAQKATKIVAGAAGWVSGGGSPSSIPWDDIERDAG
jgi:hypothetical protein